MVFHGIPIIFHGIPNQLNDQPWKPTNLRKPSATPRCDQWTNPKISRSTAFVVAWSLQSLVAVGGPRSAWLWEQKFCRCLFFFSETILCLIELEQAILTNPKTHTHTWSSAQMWYSIAQWHEISQLIGSTMCSCNLVKLLWGVAAMGQIETNGLGERPIT